MNRSAPAPPHANVMISPLQNDGGSHYSGGGNGSGNASASPVDGQQQQQQYDNSGGTYHDGGAGVNSNNEVQGDGYGMEHDGASPPWDIRNG